MCTIWAVSVRHAASDTVSNALLRGGRRGSAVDIAVVASATSSSVGRVLGNGDVMSSVGGAVFSSSMN